MWNLMNVIQVVAYLRFMVSWPANADMMLEYLDDAITLKKVSDFAVNMAFGKDFGD